jgi:HAD superfamily hydrolase (TIGR01509 family)
MQPLVIFDCDGVLVDSERLSHTVLQQMLAESGVELSFEDTVLRFMGASIPTCMATVSELLGDSLPPDFFARFAHRTRTAFEESLTAVPGVEQVLASMTTQYCVASNGDHAKVRFTLSRTGLLGRFEGRIFTAEDVAHPKPAPDLFLHAATMLLADPARTTVVEDTPTGIAAAKAAGMKAIGFAAMTPASRLQTAGADAIAITMPEVQSLLAAR